MKKFINFIYKYSLPPTFRSYEETQKSKLVHFMLLAWFFGLLVSSLYFMANWDTRLGIGLMISALFCVAGLFLNHAGHHIAAELIICGSILGGINLAIFMGIGLHDAIVMGFPIFILCSAFLFQRLGLISAAILSILSVISLYLLELNGFILSSYRSSLARVFVFSILLSVMSLITWVVRDTWESHLNHLRSSYDLTLLGWVKVLEYRDKETEGHTQRTTQNCVNMAQALGLSKDEIDNIRRGSYLHDIGKMVIPDYILLKPGPLNDEEWEIMKEHPQKAVELISGIPYLQSALDIPYYHHENWDGSGYPQGLTGEQIPLSARIFAVVDNWDALTSDRPYRKAWSDEKAKEYIMDQSGKKFDPSVTEIFLSDYVGAVQ